MKRLIAAAATLLVLSGCATREGIALPTARPSNEDVADFNKRNSAPPEAAPATATSAAPSLSPRALSKTSMLPEPEGVRIIVVGHVMAFTPYDEAALSQRYENYVKRVSAASKEPTFSKEWYLATSAGETSVKFSGVTGLYSRFFRAEVPKDIAGTINFASAFGTFMVGSSADLVAAQRHGKTGTWVTHVLCSEKDPAFAACESQYRSGVYQGIDGKEIDDKLQLVAEGSTIDPVTFKKR